MLWTRAATWDSTALLFGGTVACVIVASLVGLSCGLDTCGTYFFVPAFPACNLFLEVVPCFNLTLTVFVAMTTAQGREVYNFNVTYGSMKEIKLQEHNKGREDGLVIRSDAPVSLYLHKTLGDSMVIFPVEAYARAYDIPRLRRPGSNPATDQDSGGAGTTTKATGSSSSSTFTATDTDTLTNVTQKLLHTSLHAALYIFSPRAANVTILSSSHESLWETADSLHSSSSSNSSTPSSSTAISSSAPSTSSSSSSSSSSSPSSSSSQSLPPTQTVIKLEAFTLYKFPTNSSLVYRLYSEEAFAVVLVQSPGSPSPTSVLCRDDLLQLLDFVPPFSSSGKMFYLAFFDAVHFAVYYSGRENTTLDIVTDSESHQSRLDGTGSGFVDVPSTTAAWISSSLPVNVYVRLTMCNNSASPEKDLTTSTTSSDLSTSNSSSPSSSSPSSSSSSSPSSSSSLSSTSLSSSSSSSSASTSSSSTWSADPVCAESGFFLPSVEGYMTCDGTRSGEPEPACDCKCPSVFQRDLDPLTFLTGQALNLSASDQAPSSPASSWTRPASSVYPLLVGDLYDVSTAIARAVDFSGAYDIIVNTNSSFLVFRQDFMNMNFLPAGMSLHGSAGSACKDLLAEISHLNTVEALSPFLDAACVAEATPTKDERSNTSCQCELMLDISRLSADPRHGHSTSYKTGKSSSVILKTAHGGGSIIYWDEDDDDTTRPLIAVVVSLCVSIFAVIALIAGYMLVEMVSRRQHVRNTKIRPFVS